MAKGRMLNKKISQDEKVAKLSVEATLLYTWCIPYLDVEGKMYGDLWTLKSIVPLITSITPRIIKRIIDEWVGADLVIYYGNDVHKYLQFKGFNKNQTVHKDREAPSVIPNFSGVSPELLRSGSGQSKVNESKVNESKDLCVKAKRPVFNNYTPDTQSLLTNVFKDNLNIYALLNRFHKQSKVVLPEEVVIKVCKYYLEHKEKVRDRWAWFIVTVRKASEEYFAQKNIAEAEAFKREPVAECLKDIISRIGGVK